MNKGKSELIDMLKSGSMTLSIGEINDIMEEELNKPPEVMDTQLVDLCADALARVYENPGQQTSPQKRNKAILPRRAILLKRILAVAAVFIIVVSIAVTVSARLGDHEIISEAVAAYDGYYKIDLSSAENKAKLYFGEDTQLIKLLEGYGFKRVILPQSVTTASFSVNSTDILDEELFLTAKIAFDLGDGASGTAVIKNHKTGYTEFMAGRHKVEISSATVNQLRVNGMDIVVLSSGSKAYICYMDGDTDYFIEINGCDADGAVEIASGLKSDD